jgi:hypothetical protein
MTFICLNGLRFPSDEVYTADMIPVSVIICTHNPRPDHLQRVLNALKAQTLPKEQWQLVLIDNASREPLADQLDVRCHPHTRHPRRTVGQSRGSFARCFHH